MRRYLRRAAIHPHLWVTVYLGYIGVHSLLRLQSPRVMEYALPSWLTTAWMCALTAGGMLALAGCLTARTRVESAGLALQTFGIGLYAAIVAAVVHISPSDYAAVVTLVGVGASRMWVLSRARRAQAKAGRVRHERGGA